MGAIVIIAILAVGGTLIYRHNHKTMSGSTNSNSTSPSSTTNSSTRPQSADTYAGWKTYTNQQYGYSFKYASSWKVAEVASGGSGTVDPIEFSSNVQWDNNEKYTDVATFEIHTNDFDSVVKARDTYYAQSATAKVSKDEKVIKNKQAVHYLITFSDSNNKIEEYYFQVGSKTYSLRSINESLNLSRSATYWDDFQKVIDSLTIN